MHYISNDSLDELNALLTCIETSDSKIKGRMEIYVCKSMGSTKKLYKQLEKQYHEDYNAKQTAIHSKSAPISITAASGDDHLDFGVSVSPDNAGLHMDAAAAAAPGATANTSGEEWGAFGPMTDVQSRKMLFRFISILNAMYPWHEFSSVKPTHFRRHDMLTLVKNITNTLQLAGSNGSLLKKVWTALESSIGPNAKANISSEETAADQPLSTPTLTEEKRARRNSALPEIEEWDQDVEIYTYEPDEATGAGDPYEDEEQGTGTIWRYFYFFYNRKLKRVLFFTLRATGVTSRDFNDEDSLGWEEGSVESSQLITPENENADPSEFVDTSKLPFDTQLLASRIPPPYKAPPSRKRTLDL